MGIAANPGLAWPGTRWINEGMNECLDQVGLDSFHCLHWSLKGLRNESIWTVDCYVLLYQYLMLFLIFLNTLFSTTSWQCRRFSCIFTDSWSYLLHGACAINKPLFNWLIQKWWWDERDHTHCLVLSYVYLLFYTFIYHSATANPYLIFSNRNQLRRVNLATSEYNVLVFNLHNSIAVDFHYSNSSIYWTDVVDDKIYRGWLDENSPNAGM